MTDDTANAAIEKTAPMVAVISNPASTTNMKYLPEIRKILNAFPNAVHFELSNIGDIDEALSLFARSKPEVLIINGGDGTIGAVLAALLYRNPFTETPPIAFIPGGKTNMTAADLGYKGNSRKILKKILEVVEAGAVRTQLTDRNLVELDMGDGSTPQVGTFFGCAGIVKGIFWCREHAYSKGLPNSVAHLWSAFKLITAAFGLGKDKALMISDDMEIVVRGGGRLTGKYSIVIATTLDSLLLGAKPYGDTGSGGLRFSAVEIGGRNLIRAVRGMMSGGFGNKYFKGVHVRRGDEIRVKTQDPVTLDGEIYSVQQGQVFTLRGDRSLTFMKLI